MESLWGAFEIPEPGIPQYLCQGDRDINEFVLTPVQFWGEGYIYFFCHRVEKGHTEEAPSPELLWQQPRILNGRLSSPKATKDHLCSRKQPLLADFRESYQESSSYNRNGGQNFCG